MFNTRKEIDNLTKVEEQEQLIQDCKNTKRFGDRAMDYVKQTYIANLEELRRKYINSNMDISVYEMDAVNEFVEFLKNEA